ncbi:MAG: hypothetical protein II937_10620 [Bacteroidales bacterium]|nr:hypothetical protein [Bacteroidales bacterium]
MKKTVILMLLFVVLSFISASAQKIDLGKFVIDKNNCTITNKESGKTFNLYGNIEIVESFPDICVKIVDSFEDLDVKIVKDTPSRCCEFRKVDSFREIRVKIVTSFPDITVKLVDSFPGINH